MCLVFEDIWHNVMNTCVLGVYEPRILKIIVYLACLNLRELALFLLFLLFFFLKLPYFTEYLLYCFLEVFLADKVIDVFF